MSCNTLVEVMELPTIMASLGISESPCCSSSSVVAPSDVTIHSELDELVTDGDAAPRKIGLRKRPSQGLEGRGIAKRRCSVRPLKLDLNPQTEQEVKDYYLNKRCKLKQTCLETIFEEPKETKDGDTETMGRVKHKRAINFTGYATKAKQNRRKCKVKKSNLNRRGIEKKCKFTIQDVKRRLAETDNWCDLFQMNSS